MAIRQGIGLSVVVLAATLLASAGCAGSGGVPATNQGSATVPTVSAGSGSGTGTAGAASGASAGAPLVASKCTRCHSIDRIEKARKTREAWEKTVSRMQSNGLQVSEYERAAIVEYLASRDGGR
jgi:cytochrome c5